MNLIPKQKNPSSKVFNKVSVSKWKSLPPTENQIAYLEKYEVPVPKTRGRAAGLISDIANAINACALFGDRQEFDEYDKRDIIHENWGNECDY